MTLGAAFLLLMFTELTVADYYCLCSYNVETPVYKQPLNSSQKIGYLYEFDCKPYISNGTVDLAEWGPIAFEKQLGYVFMDPQTTVQMCPGDPAVADKLTSMAPPSSTTTAPTTALTKWTSMKISSSPSSSLTTARSTTTKEITMFKSTQIKLTSKPRTTTWIPLTMPSVTTNTVTVTNSASPVTGRETSPYTSSVSHYTTTLRSTQWQANTVTTEAKTNESSTSEATSTSKQAPTSTSKQTPTTSTSKQTPTTSTSKQTSTTSTSKQTPTTSTSQHTPTTSTSKQTPTTSTSKQTPITSTIKQTPTTSTSKQTPSTSTSKQTPTTSKSKQTPTTSTSKQTPTTSTNKQAPSTSTSKQTPTIDLHNLKLTATTPLSTSTTIKTSKVPILTTPSITGDTSKCPKSLLNYANIFNDILVQHGNYCYMVVDFRTTWKHAEDLCRGHGGHLMHISSATENGFIYTLLNDRYHHAVWMGLHDTNTEEKFIWTSGDAVTYTHWLPDRKNNHGGHRVEDCVEFIPYRNKGAWDDLPCDDRWERPFICQNTITSSFTTHTPVLNKHPCNSNIRFASQQAGGILTSSKDSCYVLVQTELVWTEAERNCNVYGGYLLEIDDQTEQTFIQHFLQRYDPQQAVWLGIHDQVKEGSFVWTTVTQDIEDCGVIMPYNHGLWDDVPCGQWDTGILRSGEEEHHFICEFGQTTSAIVGPALVGKR